MAVATAAGAVTSIAEKIATDLRSGAGGARTSIDTRGAAFGWTSGLPITLADYVTGAVSGGLTYPVVLVGDSATTAGKVAEGAAKNDAVSFTSATVALAKYAGLAEWTLERDLGAEALASVIYSVIGAQCLRALEADAVVELGAGKSSTITDTELQAAILGAQAQVLSNGSRPGVLVIGPAGYAALGSTPGYGYSALSPDPGAGPVGRLYGMAVHVSGSITDAATAYVVDPAAVLAVQQAGSPYVVADALTLAANNKLRLIVDLFAAVKVVSPGGVVAAAVSP